jgi:hypothetical protein
MVLAPHFRSGADDYLISMLTASGSPRTIVDGHNTFAVSAAYAS